MLTTKRTKRIFKTKQYERAYALKITSLSSCVVLAIIFAFVIITFMFRPCTKHMDCSTSNTCSHDYCENSFCRHEWIDQCCLDYTDCKSTQCHTSVCDRGTCRLTQIQNNSDCNDYNKCTVNDVCRNGHCDGNQLNCNTNQCSQPSCHKDVGCQYQHKENGEACDDENECTIVDTCFEGLCASGVSKDCSAIDTDCKVGICDITSGECFAVNRNNGFVCDDSTSCTYNDGCVDGTCKGTVDPCYDNNPCTYDKCIEGVGCMIQHRYDNGTCIAGCTDNIHCPDGYVCHDGTCLNIPVGDDFEIRFLNYEIRNCSYNSQKLLMTYVMDATTITVADTDYYRIVLGQR